MVPWSVGWRVGVERRMLGKEDKEPGHLGGDLGEREGGLGEPQILGTDADDTRA